MSAPSRTERIALAALVASVFFAITLLWLSVNDPRRGAGDFMFPWLAARALLDGREPYAAVLAGSPYRSGFFYPLPAALIAMPFAGLPPRFAGALFVGVGFGWLSYMLLAGGRWRLLVLTAAPALFAVLAVQWSPLLTAAALSGPALALVIAKPTIGIALAASVLPGATRPGRLLLAAAGGAIALLAVSLLLRPDWPAQWIAVLSNDASAGQYRAPILTPYGFPAALAVLRWRRPEARLLVALACVRQNGFMYDQLPLLLVPGNAVQAVALSVISHVSHIVALWRPPTDGSILSLSTQQYPFTVAAMYVPCVLMVLRRPNEGRVPRWVERAALRLPDWLRGQPAPGGTTDVSRERVS
jgi:hypothetical protein